MLLSNWFVMNLCLYKIKKEVIMDKVMLVKEVVIVCDVLDFFILELV